MQLRAYDRDTGKVLWSYTLPGGSEGIPATYELGGRQYLAVPVAAGAGLFAPLLDPGAGCAAARACVRRVRAAAVAAAAGARQEIESKNSS